MVDQLDAARRWLVEARRRGFLGPGPIEPLVLHSLGFAGVVEKLVEAVPSAVLDLGAGGGIPGLVLAARWPEARMGLVEGSVRRAAFLAEAVEELGWAGEERVRVVTSRAEDLGRDPAWRERASVVVARLFGAPAVTAECAAPLLQVEGWLVVSEPPESGPGSGERWPAADLARLGLRPVEVLRERGFGYQVLRKVEPTPDRYPRRVGIPAKRPLY
jgi:16S rRNA (guanine527-N7)-methyltransferase